MAIPLPNQDKIIGPIDVQGELIATEMRAGAGTMRVTIGPRPWAERFTVQWMLSVEEAVEQLAEFRSQHYSGEYTITLPVYGEIVIRPTSAASVGRINGNRKVRFMLPVEVL